MAIKCETEISMLAQILQDYINTLPTSTGVAVSRLVDDLLKPIILILSEQD